MYLSICSAQTSLDKKKKKKYHFKMTDEVTQWLKEHGYLNAETDSMSPGKKNKDLDTENRLKDLDVAQYIVGGSKTEEERLDFEGLRSFLATEQETSTVYWKWKTDWGKKLATYIFAPKMGVSSVYRLNYPLTNQAIDYFHTKYSTQGYFLEALCKNVDTGKSTLDEQTFQYAILPKHLIEKYSQRPFFFGLIYR